MVVGSGQQPGELCRRVGERSVKKHCESDTFEVGCEPLQARPVLDYAMLGIVKVPAGLERLGRTEYFKWNLTK
jgi:hypothetical protein